MVDGVADEGWFASDFTLAEIKTLRAVQPMRRARPAVRRPVRDPDLRGGPRRSPRKREPQARPPRRRLSGDQAPDLPPADLGLPLEGPLVAALTAPGSTAADAPVFIQSFEQCNLQRLNRMTPVKLVQLVDANDIDANGSLSYAAAVRPALRLDASGKTKLLARTFGFFTTDAGLKEIAKYADGIGPWKPLHPVDRGPGRQRRRHDRRRERRRQGQRRRPQGAPADRRSSTARTRAGLTSTRGRSATSRYRLAYDDARRPAQRVPALLPDRRRRRLLRLPGRPPWRRASSPRQLMTAAGRRPGSLRPVIHLRIVAERGKTERALELLEGSQSVCNVVYSPGAARDPTGDVILADVAREDASVMISDLKELGSTRDGAITLEHDRHADLRPRRARRRARARRRPPTRSCGRRSRRARARTSSSPASFLAFMVHRRPARGGRHLPELADPDRRRDGRRAGVRAAGRLLRRARAAAPRCSRCARRSALAVGFPLGDRRRLRSRRWSSGRSGSSTDTFSHEDHSLANIIAAPDFLTFFVAACAGAAGHAEPEHGQVRRADRRADLGHDDPRGRQRRRRRRLPGLVELARQHRRSSRSTSARSSSPAPPSRPPARSSTSAAGAPPATTRSVGAGRSTPTSRATTRSRPSS